MRESHSFSVVLTAMEFIAGVQKLYCPTSASPCPVPTGVSVCPAPSPLMTVVSVQDVLRV